MKVIKSLFGEDGALGMARPMGQSFSIWMNILKAIRDLDGKNTNLDIFVKKKVGDGRGTRFWEDNWCGDMPLKSLFPRIYRLDLETQPLVYHRRNLNYRVSWLRRIPRGGAEQEQWTSLLNLMNAYVFSEQCDRWIWSGDGTGIFSVSNARNIIDHRTLIVEDKPTRWIKEVPGKVNIFVWKMLIDRLPTRWNLSVKGFEVQSMSCGICDNMIESIFHVIIDCDVAKEVWKLIERWWNVDIPDHNSIHIRFSWVDGLKMKRKTKKAFMAVIFTTTWVLWRFRNESIFGTYKPKKAHIFDNIVNQSFHWITCRNRKLKPFWLGFICNPILVLDSL